MIYGGGPAIVNHNMYLLHEVREDRDAQREMKKMIANMNPKSEP
jgi:hypothetical protein